MHRLLARQLKKLGIDTELTGNAVPDKDQWAKLLTQIDQSYRAADQDRYTLERSLTISSDEMQQLYQQLKSAYEGRMESILNAIPDVLFLIDEDGKCLEVMSGNRNLAEANRELGLNRNISELFDESRTKIFMDAIHQAIESNDLVVVQYDLELSDGLHYFEGRVMSSRNEIDGKRTVVFIAIDITKRVKADIQSRLISTMFDSTKEGMLILDRELNIVKYNDAFVHLTGETAQSVDAAIPRFIEKLMSRADGTLIRRTVQKDGYWLGEITGYHRDGKRYPLLLTINSVSDNNGRVTNYVITLSDVSEIKRSQEELEHVATHDALTKLPNRILFQDRLEQAVKRAVRSNTMGALMFLDLDRFKNINDNLGHQVGDELLVQASERLSSICRSSDTLARLGGDEFTLIVEGLCDNDELAIIAEKILDKFKDPFHLSGYNLDISVSIGISVFPRDSEDPIEITKHADTAMYSAKESGRNTYQYYRQELTSSAFEYFATEIALRKAMDRNEFFLVYQPQYEIRSNRIIGVEALLRWRHPDMGVVSPSVFIKIAETNGQIIDIGRWVIEEACRNYADWKDMTGDDFTISINLSRKQLMVPELASDVGNILDSHDISAGSIELEITESAIIDNREIAMKNIEDLKALGVSMAIDDFGTGFSSLVNLKQFPLARLKIDQSFVRDVTKDANDEAIIRATIALGKSLQLRVIAEGVEKKEQRDFLLREGCDEVQGYLYSEPLIAEDITDLLRTAKASSL